MSHLRGTEGLRILDIGPTSPGNINYVTGLGHSIYMANLVEEAARPEWLAPQADGAPAKFNVEGYLAANLDFSGRSFDVVLLWDTMDYLPVELAAPIVTGLYSVMVPEAQMLAFFHSKESGPETGFCRYHLTGTDEVEMQRAGSYPVTQIYSNRQVETMLQLFRSHRFFLGKGALREVLAIR